MNQYDRETTPAAGEVLQFIQRVRRRFNWHAGWHGGFWAWLWISVALLAGAALAVLRGQQVPWSLYGWAAGIGLGLALVLWFRWRVTEDRAAQLADRVFQLKDSLRSCRNFLQAGHQDGFYDLQAQQTAEEVREKSLDSIRFQPAWPAVWVALICTAVAVGLGFQGPSARLVAEEALRQATLQNTDALNEELAELVEQLELETSDETERELINANQLREWVKELEATGDPREAMRQYAKLERKIEQAAQALQNRRDEQLLDRAATELKKDPVNRDLADLLKQKKLDQAAKELEKLKLAPREKQRGLKLTEQQKELAKLRAAAQRMAEASRRDAARSRDSRGSQAGQMEGNSDRSRDPSDSGLDLLNVPDSPNSRQGDGERDQDNDPGDEGGEEEQTDEDLEALMQQLEEDLKAWEEALEKLELNEDDQQNGEMGECEACRGRVNGRLDQMGQQLRRLARQRAAQARLRGLAKKFGEAQARARGAGQGQGDQPGGREAGQGASDRQRADKDNLETKQRASRLQGQHGVGPSLTQIQAADFGTGVSRRVGEAVQRDFQRQFESFVEREDIPEDLKSGVKNYFLQIQQTEDLPDQSLPQSP